LFDIISGPTLHGGSARAFRAIRGLDLRYLEKAIFQPTYTRNGQIRKVGEWAAKNPARRTTRNIFAVPQVAKWEHIGN
ncbi:MAG: hypothetical protein DME76_13310, partial [Verrucomicrobia bacterium]